MHLEKKIQRVRLTLEPEQSAFSHFEKRNGRVRSKVTLEQGMHGPREAPNTASLKYEAHSSMEVNPRDSEGAERPRERDPEK